MIRVCNVEHKYKDKQVLFDINFTMENGIYGLIGPNGAGKSTLIHIMTTLLAPTSGTIFLNDTPTQELGQEYRNIIGLMPQKQSGYAEYTGIQFLYYMATLKGMDKKQANTEIEMLIRQVNLSKDVHRKIKTYSGGMRQRLMFAQALLNSPKILILDEPTAGLDPYERIRMRNYISQMANNRIVLIATHVMQDIEAIADEILLLKRGKIIYKGSIETILTTINNKVFECKVSEDKLTQLTENYRVSQLTKYDNLFKVQYINEAFDSQGVAVNPSLEDVYLYYMVDKDDSN